MVIEGYPVRPHKKAPPLAKAVEPHSAAMAKPLDRMAAAVIDWLVILTPVLLAVFAPFKRMMVESLVLEAQSAFAQAMALSAAALLLLVFLYHTICIYLWGATPGKMAFGLRVMEVWRHKRPGLGACALRATVMIGELACLGLPWLGILANSKRRPLHDRIADTMVVTARKPAAAPGTMEISFVRGVYAAAWAFLLMGSVVATLEILGTVSTEEDVLSWLENKKDEAPRCDTVTEAIKDQPDTLAVDERLQVAMELFAAGLVNQTCLEEEADWVMNQPGQPMAVAYLAKAFANAENGETSNAYLEKACEIEPKSEACQMTTIVQKWSDEDWDRVAELFSGLPDPASPHVTVWKIRYHMKQGNFEQALAAIATLSGSSALASYIIPERIKALWQANRLDEARLVATTAYETLSGPEVLDVSGWMCYQELSRKCSEVHPVSCEKFVREAHAQNDSTLQPTEWLAMVLLKESCRGQTSSGEYINLKEAAGPGAVGKLLTGLDLWSRGQSEEARREMANLIEDEKQPEEIRSEALRRMLTWSQEGKQLREWIAHWEHLKPGLKRALGPTLFQILRNRGELGEALKVGWRLLDENRADLQINRDLVVTAYQLGRRRDAWNFLKSYRERYDMVNNGRSPATADEFLAIARLLEKEFSGR